MKKNIIFIALVVILASCRTITSKNAWQVPVEEKTGICYSIENDTISATLTASDNKWVTLNIKNKTNEVILIVSDLSSYTDRNGNNTRLNAEGTKYIDSSRSQPNVTIPPKSNFVKSFSSANETRYVNSVWFINDWIPKNLTGSSFVFGLQSNNKDSYLVFNDDNFVKPKKVEQSIPIVNGHPILGTVTVDKTLTIFFFRNTVDARRAKMRSLALDKAKHDYGANVNLINERYLGSHDIFTVVMCGLGWIEDASLTADVVAE